MPLLVIVFEPSFMSEQVTYKKISSTHMESGKCFPFGRVPLPPLRLGIKDFVRKKGLSSYLFLNHKFSFMSEPIAYWKINWTPSGIMYFFWREKASPIRYF